MRFGCGPMNQIVLGDLIERYRTQRRSRGWFWKQSLIAIAVSVWSEMKQQKFVTFRGFILGWIALGCFEVFVVSPILPRLFNSWLPAEWFQSSQFTTFLEVTVSSLTALIGGFLAGGTAAWTSKGGKAAVLLFAVSLNCLMATSLQSVYAYGNATGVLIYLLAWLMGNCGVLIAGSRQS
jgi:hypothetical protein